MNENVNVCITPKGEKPVLHFSQFDNERVFTVTVLADDGESAAILTGLNIEFRLRKTDSHVVTIAPESVADNVITFKTTEQLCACCGQNIATVTLMKDDMVVSTLDILVDIQRDILSGGLPSESDIRNLTTQIEQIVPEVVGDNYYNKSEVDDLIAEHTFDPSNYYDKSEVDDLIAEHTFDPSNYYDKSEVDGLLDDKADKSAIASLIVQKDVSKAPIASFNTDLNDNLTKCIVDINPVQDLHGYSKPWSGGGGKNKLRTTLTNQTTKGIVFTVNADGTFTANGTATGGYSQVIVGMISLPAGDYIFSDEGNFARNNDIELYISGVSGSSTKYSDNRRFTLTSPLTNANVFFYIGNGKSINTIIKPMIRPASEPAGFAPYSNICPISGFSTLNVTLADGDMQTVDTKTVNFGQTVYGGVVDIANGKVNVTRNIVDLSTLNWVYASGANRWEAQKTDMKNYPSRNADIIFEKYETDITATAGSEGKGFISGLVIYVTSNDSTTPPSGNACYPLATPIEITTTPENLTAIIGENNVYGDTNGDIAVRFTETIGNELGV